jgi:hypothetical protein
LFHYIISQNNGDNSKPENFLRIRGNGTRVIFECGVWISGANHEIGVDLDRNKHIGVELYLVGRYNATAHKWSLSINGEEVVSTQTDPVGAVAVDDGQWMIATHNCPGKERYFKGQIFYAAVDNKAPASSILVTDSDNNGIISDYSKNAARAEAEHNIGSAANPTPKPITYFPGAASSVPPDYAHVQIRIIPGIFGASTKCRLKCTNNLEVVKGTKAGATITYDDANPIADTTDLSPDDATNLYFAKAKSAGAGIDKVELYEVVNGVESKVDSTAFEARQTLNGWIIPSGWKIAGNTITTPMPVTEDTVGPQNEGSGPFGSTYGDKGGIQSPTNPRGDAFSVATYNGGFILELDFAFERNKSQDCPDAYVQRDANKDEKFDGTRSRKMDMFGNSGIKFFGKEILLFDIVKMIDGLSMQVGGQLAPGIVVDNDGKIHSDTDTNNLVVNGVKYASARACNVITGDIYTSDDQNPPHSGTPNDWAGMKTAYDNQMNTPAGQKYRHLKIEVTDTSSIAKTKYNVEVTLTNATSVLWTDVEVAAGYDKHVFLQSHWGSGVSFKNISITGK